MKINKKGIKRAVIILLTVCMVLMCFVAAGVVADTYALEKPVEVKEVVELEESIVEVDLAKDFRAEKEVNLEEIKSIQDTVIEESVEVEKPNKELTIEERIRLACEDYDVPFDLALAIARLETGWFKSNAYKNKNNPGGLSRNEKPIAFDTIEEGVDAFVGNLSRNYIKKGLNTPEKIGKKYCPVNPDWAKLVRSLMEYGRNIWT